MVFTSGMRASRVTDRALLAAGHSLPRLQRNVTPLDPVLQRVKASLPMTLGRLVQAALEFSHFVVG